MDISHILENTSQYKKCLQDRFLDPFMIDEIVILHKSYTSELHDLENLNKLRNIISSCVSNKRTETKSDLTDYNKLLDSMPESYLISLIDCDNLCNYSKSSLICIGKKIKDLIYVKEKTVKDLFTDRNKLVSFVPNLLHSDVPIFESETNNKIIFNNSLNEKKKFDQYELCCKLEILEDGSKLSGNRGYFMVNEGVRLNYALINYALDFLDKKKYKLMYTPHFLDKQHMEKICQLSEFDETLYELKDTGHFLIATSEQPLTAYFSKKQLNTLPEMLCGISTCYRKESGSHGKDTLGMFRVHQFEKVEQFCVTDSESSWEMMEKMINISKEFYDSLGLSYRVVSIVSKELNNAAGMKYDLEGWFPGSEKYRELVSCSNTTDYFSRKIKVTDSNGKYVHMLNSTLCANTRTLCCILETYQTDDGVLIPEVLKKYYSVDKISFKK